MVSLSGVWPPNSQALRGACCWQSCQQGRKKNARLSDRNKSWRVFCQAIQAFIHLLLHAEYLEGGRGGEKWAKGELRQACTGGKSKLSPPPTYSFSFLPSTKPHLACIGYLSWFVFSMTFPLVALAPDGLHAKGEQRDLHMLWVWGL